MPSNIYIGKRSSKEGWISFESDPHHKRTRDDIYGRCLPCIENLRKQLIAGKKEIQLKEPLNCWKVTIILKNLDECYEFLSLYENKYLFRDVYGKFGSGRKDADTKVTVFHTQSEKERDTLYKEAKECLMVLGRERNVFISRGCANLYGDILGDWKNWKVFTPLKDGVNVRKKIEMLNKLLYYSS
ncbi:MAG: hypothetical protein SV062_01125 [Thermodesulfobacteriota bacterium]|nr:hypothetical protein [Thermodesulfobacteriota bacterium]